MEREMSEMSRSFFSLFSENEKKSRSIFNSIARDHHVIISSITGSGEEHDHDEHLFVLVFVLLLLLFSDFTLLLYLASVH